MTKIIRIYYTYNSKRRFEKGKLSARVGRKAIGSLREDSRVAGIAENMSYPIKG